MHLHKPCNFDLLCSQQILWGAKWISIPWFAKMHVVRFWFILMNLLWKFFCKYIHSNSDISSTNPPFVLHACIPHNALTIPQYTGLTLPISDCQKFCFLFWCTIKFLALCLIINYNNPPQHTHTHNPYKPTSSPYLLSYLLSFLVCHQTILSKHIVIFMNNCKNIIQRNINVLSKFLYTSLHAIIVAINIPEGELLSLNKNALLLKFLFFFFSISYHHSPFVLQFWINLSPLQFPQCIFVLTFSGNPAFPVEPPEIKFEESI